MAIYNGNQKVAVNGIEKVYVGNAQIYSSLVPFRMTVSGLGTANNVTVSTDEGAIPEFNEVTIGNDIFIKIPTIYRKINSTAYFVYGGHQITSFTLSNYKVDDSYEPYPCFLKEDGITVMSYILIGKYPISSTSVANSVDVNAASFTLTDARTLCRAKGDGYQQWDWMIYKLWQDLMICKVQGIRKIIMDSSRQDKLGLFWQDPFLSGRGATWVDGVITSEVYGSKWYFCYKPSAYIGTEPSVSTDYIESPYYKHLSDEQRPIMSIGYDSSCSFFNFPSYIGGDYSDDYYSGICSIRAGGLYYVQCRPTDGYIYSYYDTTGNAGSRLCYRPV